MGETLLQGVADDLFPKQSSLLALSLDMEEPAEPHVRIHR